MPPSEPHRVKPVSEPVHPGSTTDQRVQLDQGPSAADTTEYLAAEAGANAHPTAIPPIPGQLSGDQPSEFGTLPAQPARSDVSLRDFQQLIHKMYYAKDIVRGVDGTFMWLMEEVGELAAALRQDSQENRLEEFADVLAWLATIANVAGIDLSQAVQRKYGSGCPGCGQFVCSCDNSEKP